jgi:hypothetical protein
MRRFLLNLGCLFAAFAALLAGLTIPSGQAVPGTLTALVLLAFGVLLSAPYAVMPPEERQRVTLWLLPVDIWLAVQLFQGILWVGEQLLSLVWLGIFRVLARRRARRHLVEPDASVSSMGCVRRE